MEKEIKFYEERMHEKELPNKMGQYRNWLRDMTHDRYGNKLVTNRKRTYFGEMVTRINTEELSFNPKTIFNYTDTQVREFLKRLVMIVPDSKLNLNNLQVFIKKTYGHPEVINRGEYSVFVFEDDGNTRTEGFHYDIYWVLPLSDRNQYLESAVFDGYVCDSILFQLRFDERVHDSNLSSRFFSLYFNGVMKEEIHGKKIETRIDYNNDNMTINSIITPENLFRVGKKLIEYKQDEELLTKAKLAFEQ